MSEAAPEQEPHSGPAHLSVKELKAKMACYTVAQCNAAFSTGSPIGTTGMSNCLGIVIYNRLGTCGVVAHVEAQPSATYAGVVDGVLQALMHKMNTSGGERGSLSVVLMGNSGGGDAEFSGAVEASLYRHVGARLRLSSLDILDLRNFTARGTIGRATTNLGGNFGACILDPANEVLWVDTGLHVTNVASRPADVAHLVIQ